MYIGEVKRKYHKKSFEKRDGFFNKHLDFKVIMPPKRVRLLWLNADRKDLKHELSAVK